MITDLKPYSDYKETTIPWLARLPGHWDVRRLRHVCEMRVSNVDKHTKKGETPVRLCNYVDVYKNERIRESGPFMVASATEDERIRFCLHKLDVLITKDSEDWKDIGVPSLVEFEAPDLVCGYHLAILRPRPALHGTFLHRALQCHYIAAQFHVEANGVTRYGLSHGAIQSVSIPLPPPDEQVAIVRFLDWANGRLERAIRAKRKVNALLREQKQAIIHRAVTSGLDPSAPLKPSGIPWLGDIPRHWEVRRLKHISPGIGVGLVVNPSSYFVDETHPAPVPMLLGNNITPNGFRLEKVRHICADDNRRLAASRLTSGDVVVVRVGAPGVAAVIPPSLDGCNCASVVIVRKHTSFVSQWLAHVFNSPVVASQVEVVKYGAAQTQFNISHAVDFLFPVPPKAEQQKVVDGISECTAPLNRAVHMAEKEIDLLREYRSRLVADVVTGKLDVREAAKKLPEQAETEIVEDDADLIDEIESADEEAVV